jgi:hypothetical protein
MKNNLLTIAVALRSVLLIAPVMQGASAANLEIAIRPEIEAGGLNGISPHCPDNVFDFGTREVVAVCDVDPERLNQAAALLPHAANVRQYADDRRLLADQSIDTVCIAPLRSLAYTYRTGYELPYRG